MKIALEVPDLPDGYEGSVVELTVPQTGELFFNGDRWQICDGHETGTRIVCINAVLVRTTLVRNIPPLPTGITCRCIEFCDVYHAGANDMLISSRLGAWQWGPGTAIGSSIGLIARDCRSNAV